MEPDWRNLATINGVYITFNFPRSIDDIVEDVPLRRNKTKRVQIKIAPNPFSRGKYLTNRVQFKHFLGVERIAFYGQDINTGFMTTVFGRYAPYKEIVLKEYAHEFTGNLSKRFETSNQVS